MSARNSHISLPARPRARLVVGIDYGTTYSGIGFARSTATDFHDIHVWTAYPGASSHRSEHCEKAPSWIAFASENDDLTDNAWGYEVEPGMSICAWTKLLLDSTALSSEYDDPSLHNDANNGRMRLPPGETAKGVVTEYLRGIYRMYTQTMNEKFGERQLESLPVDIWLTVPATWSEKAKLMTRDAAADAGFASRPGDSLRLISEPEAAAHLALKSSIYHVQDLVRNDTRVMVCDLGGGTVDITTYEIQETTPSLKMREVCVGGGGKCGGTFVDRNLYKLMEDRFGTAFTSLDPRIIGPGSPFMDQFELKKRDFSMKYPSRRPHRLTLLMRNLEMTPELAKYYEEPFSYVLITQDDMKSLFDPVVEVIINLVADQVERVRLEESKSIETMVLVGGFGSSPYIKERLKEWCDARNIRLTTPISGAYDVPAETIDHKNVEKVGAVEYTLSDLNIDELETTVDEDGMRVYKVRLTLNIRLSDEAGVLVFTILSKGKECGQARLVVPYA
ncbi:hypothetical protein ACJ41O_006026 [Fusarium nematophilum]